MIVESKLKTGKLTLGTPGTEFACQQTNVRIVPSFNEEGDAVETLCGDTLAPATTTEWALQGTSIQDFDAPGGVSFQQYSWEHNLQEVPFTWQPNTTAVKYVGTVQVRALEVGGDVNTRITTDFDWPVSGQPVATWAPAAVAATGATAGVPGTWTPASSTPPATVAALIAGTPNAVVASPTTAWTTGQYVQTATAGAPGQAHWDGTAWVAAPALLAADDQDVEGTYSDAD